MPRPRQSSAGLQLSPGQAKYVLGRLVSDRRVSAAEVNRYVGEMRREIATLEQQLNELREASGGAAVRRAAAAAPWSPKPAGRPAGAPRGRRRRRAAITAEQRASRQLQGRYLGLIRQIPANKRGQYQKTAREKGREAAIKEMQTALKK